MRALLKTLLLCNMILLFWSCPTLEAGPSAAAGEQHSPRQLAQSKVPLPSRQPVNATDAKGQVPPPSHRPVSAANARGQVPLPPRRPVNATTARAERAVAPPIVEGTSVSSGDVPQTTATEPGVSTKMGASAAWEACIAQVEILQRAARQRKIQACTEVLAQSPAESESRRKEALKQRALAYAVAQRSLAIADYSAALEIDSTDVESLLARGALYLKGGGWGNERGQYDLAIADFNQAIVLNPRNAQAFIYRGDAHRATLGSSQAAQDYRQALEIDPTFAAARIRLDSSQQDLQPRKENEDYETCRNRTLNADKRIEACSKFISTIPEFYNKSHRTLIASRDNISADSIKSLKKSVNSLSLASDIDSGMTERGYAFAFRALGNLEKGDLESALVDLNHAIDRAPIMIYGNGEASTRDRLLLRRGEIYLETKEYDRAEADFRAVLKVNFVPDGHSNLALLHFTREHYDLALSEVALALKRDPKNALAFSLRGRIALNRQQYQRALEDCQQAVELSKPNRAPNAERCIEAAREGLAQTSSNSQSASGKSK